jgi:hypothetical protein
MAGGFPENGKYKGCPLTVPKRLIYRQFAFRRREIANDFRCGKIAAEQRKVDSYVQIGRQRPISGP